MAQFGGGGLKAADKKGGGDGGGKKQGPPPNGFLCLSIENDGNEIASRITRLQSDLCTADPSLEDVLVPIPQLHITLALFNYADESQLREVLRVLHANLPPILDAQLPPSTPITFRGLFSFSEKVLNVRPGPTDALTAVSLSIDALLKSVPGLTSFAQTTPHVTVAKIPRASPTRLIKDSLWQSSHYADQKFGTAFATAGVHVCLMKGREETGTGCYKTVATILHASPPSCYLPPALHLPVLSAPLSALQFLHSQKKILYAAAFLTESSAQVGIRLARSLKVSKKVSHKSLEILLSRHVTVAHSSRFPEQPDACASFFNTIASLLGVRFAFSANFGAADHGGTAIGVTPSLHPSQVPPPPPFPTPLDVLSSLCDVGEQHLLHVTLSHAKSERAVRSSALLQQVLAARDDASKHADKGKLGGGGGNVDALTKYVSSELIGDLLKEETDRDFVGVFGIAVVGMGGVTHLRSAIEVLRYANKMREYEERKGSKK